MVLWEVLRSHPLPRGWREDEARRFESFHPDHTLESDNYIWFFFIIYINIGNSWLWEDEARRFESFHPDHNIYWVVDFIYYFFYTYFNYIIVSTWFWEDEDRRFESFHPDHILESYFYLSDFFALLYRYTCHIERKRNISQKMLLIGKTSVGP